MINKSLSHAFEIYRLVRQDHHSRVEAAKKVGKRNRITYATVMSSCTRDINISTDKFDDFLEPENAVEFKNFLIIRFPDNQDEIIEFFNVFEETIEEVEKDMVEKLVRPLLPEEKKTLFNQIILSSMRDKFHNWISRDDVPKDIKNDIQKWLKKL